MNKKFELVPQENTLLFRIRALKDFSDVKAGDLGGFVAAEDNLSHDGNCWVYGAAQVYGSAHVFGNAQVHGSALVYGDAVVHGNVQVYGSARVYDNARVYGSAHVFGNAQVHGSAHVYGSARVFGGAQVYGNARVYDNAHVYGSAHVFGNARVHGSARVYDNARVFGGAQVYGSAHVHGSARICERQWIRFGYCTKYTLVDLLRCSLGVNPTASGYIYVYKRVNIDYTSEHDNTFVYPQSGLVEAKEYDSDPTKSCASGLHFSTNEYWPIEDETKQRMLVARVHIDDIIACQEGKIRVKRAEIL